MPFFARILLVFMLLISAGCPPTKDTMDNVLYVRNNSSTKIKLLLNLSYPDSSLSNAFLERYLNPNSEESVGSIYDLDLPGFSGLTVFVFDHAYYKSRWHEQVGKPDTYLEEDKILKRYVLSKSELDSLNWKLTYP